MNWQIKKIYHLNITYHLSLLAELVSSNTASFSSMLYQSLVWAEGWIGVKLLVINLYHLYGMKYLKML